MTHPIITLSSALFEGCRPEVVNGDLSKSEAMLVARRFVEVLHPNAICAFLFGSAIRDAFSAYSDLDLIIIEREPLHLGARRHAFDGCPIEAHLFSRQTFLEALRTAAASGRINIAFALLNCEILLDVSGLGAELCLLVTQVERAGPPTMTREVANLAYCTVATSLFELAANPSQDERFATMITLQTIMMNFFFAGRRQWANARKWAIRDAPDFARALNRALSEAHLTGDVDLLVGILEELAAPWPGLRWDGAHATNRLL